MGFERSEETMGKAAKKFGGIFQIKSTRNSNLFNKPRWISILLNVVIALRSSMECAT
jgi:hypothetical protein